MAKLYLYESPGGKEYIAIVTDDEQGMEFVGDMAGDGYKASDFVTLTHDVGLWPTNRLMVED